MRAYDKVTDGNGFGLVAFAEKGMEVDVPACAYSFARESINGLIIWDHSL